MVKECYNLDGEVVTIDLHDPDPGVYVGLSHWDYIVINAVSRSDLKNFRDAPEKFRSRSRELTPSLIFGTQYHAYILENDTFKDRFVMYDGRRDMRIEKYSSLVDEWGAEYIYKPKDLATLKAMRSSLMDYRKAAKILTNKNPKEVTVVAICPITGLKLKIRIDVVLTGTDFVADLKTTHSATWSNFRWSIINYWYDGQAAFYIMVCRLVPELRHVNNFAIVAQEKDPESNYMVRTYKVHDTNVASATVEVSRLLGELRDWMDAGEPFPDEIIDLDTFGEQ